MKKTGILLLCALLTAQALTGCGENTAEETDADTEDTTAAVETLSEEEQKQQEKNSYFDSLAAEIANPGTEITFIAEVDDIFVEEELTGEKFSDAVYNRNLEVEDRLNVKIVQNRRERSTGDLKAIVNQSVMAGDGAHDAINCYTYNVAEIFNAGSLLDMDNIPNLQLDEAWWNQSANENFTFGNYRFCALSSLCHYADDVAEIVLFNKEMCINYGLELPYEAVREGRWTYDMMFAMIDTLPLDSNGDGIMDYNDIIGVSGQAQDVQAAMVSCGVDFFTKDENDFPVFILNNEENADKFTLLFDHLTDTTRIVLVDIYKNLPDVWDYWGGKFRAGEALFMLNFPCNLSSYTEMEEDYGILPMPKYSEDQKEYRTMTSVWRTSSLSVPKIIDADPSDLGLVLDALSYLSYVDVEPTYISSYLEKRYVRDEDSAEMMTIALQNKYYDPGFVMNFIWGQPMTITTNLVSAGKNIFASTIASRISAIENAVEKSKKLIQENE